MKKDRAPSTKTDGKRGLPGLRPASASGLDLLISLHIPKTAGMSFRSVLKKAYGKRLHYDYRGDPSATSRLILETMYAPQVSDRAALLREACHDKRLRCIHGHFGAGTYYELVPDADFVFWVRDPVERVISEFFHLRRRPDPFEEVNRQVYEGLINLWQFAEVPRVRNVCYRKTLAVPFEQFSFIGIAERFEESMEFFARRFSLRVRPKDWRRKVNENRHKPLLENSKLREHILSLNQPEQELYERVQGLYDV